MSVNKDGTRFWLNKGETATVEFKTLGAIDEYKGKKERIMGEKSFVHVATDAIFEGRKTALCGGSGCPHCGAGHKASVQIRDVPVIVEGTEMVWTLQKSLNNVVGEKISAMLEFGHDPADFVFRIEHTQLKYPDNWAVEVIKKDTAKAMGGKVIGPAPEQAVLPDREPTDAELDAMRAIDSFLEASGDEVSPEDWVATLTEANGWDIIRAKELVAAVVDKKGRLKAE